MDSNRFWTSSWAAALWLPLWLLPLLTQTSSAAAVNYNRDIRPILSDNCFACHGPDPSHRKAKLRLDVRHEAISREAIVPGNPEESEFVRRIFTTDEDDLMPPPKSQKILTEVQRELLRRWIAEGAEYEGHWAYVPPAKEPLPAEENGIDQLVRKRLTEIGLEPSPEADRRTLARRLHFDLIGIPPKPGEVEAFEQECEPGAYQSLVEKLLASPHYGERMAIGWLDVVRFADTIGYHSDNPRNIWPYRDYVIRAFNENKPFDQFTREQVAGDLLPESTLEQKVASGFNRLLLSTEEGGAQPKDYEARMLTDRVRAVGSVWIGQTLGCAQCHDHKFDPITARDFYSMGAFFADLKEPIIGRREEGMLVPTVNQTAELERLEAEMARWRTQFEVSRPEMLANWEQGARQTVEAETHWTVLKPEEAQNAKGGKLSVARDGVITVDKNPAEGTDTYRIRIRPEMPGIVGLRLEALTSENLPGQGPGRADEGGFVLTEFGVEDELGHPIELGDSRASWETAGSPALSAVDGQTGATNGWAVQGMSGVPQALYVATQEAIDCETITIVLTQAQGNNAVLGRFRLSATTDPSVLGVRPAPMPPPEIAQILRLATEDRTEPQNSKLAAYHRSIAPELAGLRQQLATAQKAKDTFEATVPRTLVSSSLEKPRTVRILPRGNWMVDTGEIVQPALPGYLVDAAPKPDRPLNRLDLANWLVSRENPLTARVVMNRLWKQFFGIGLSKVLDDFGAQGEPPPNQALLDWLACEFMDSGWDFKHMVRLIVNSQTYRQVSTASKELHARDPDNRELARQSRWRLEAELVRDNVLSIADLLVPSIGGPSVNPYQPDGYWENLNFPVRTYKPSSGPDQYRRGLYTWWQRSYLHPSLLAFDAPTREECAADRPRSNIPQQALVLLNDPTYVEAARVFASRILRDGGPNTASRLAWAWRQTLSRAPRPDEMQTIEALLSKHVSEYRQHPDRAQALLGVGQASIPAEIDPSELAAWTSVARVLLNLHETITRS